MFYACATRFDVTENFENERNESATWQAGRRGPAAIQSSTAHRQHASTAQSSEAGRTARDELSQFLCDGVPSATDSNADIKRA